MFELIVNLLHTCINVKNMDQSIKFYCEKMNMQLQGRRNVAENNAEISFLSDSKSDHRIELTCWNEKTDYEEGDQLDHLAFEVEDIESKINEFRDSGVKIEKEPFKLTGSTSKIAFITDPNGIWIELIEKNK